MSNEVVQVSTTNQLKKWFSNESLIKQLGSQLSISPQAFTSSVLSVVNNNKYLRNADPASIYGATMVAASMNLQVNPSLGECAIIPYGKQAQFQVMRSGLVQLAMRSGVIKSLINEIVYEGQLVKKNKFKGVYEFDEDAKTSDKVIGYMSYMETVEGFEKTLYMTVDEVKEHAKKFSKTYQSGSGIWKENFDAMAMKTVLKKLLSKWAPKSVAPARQFDQAVVKINPDKGQNDIEDAEVVYVDNDNENENAKTAIAEAAEKAATAAKESKEPETKPSK
jgi:recombination protein RecT